MHRREPPAAPFVFSLLLHALVLAALVSGLAAPAGREDRAAALALLPETVNFHFVEAPAAPAAEPDEPTNLAAERDAQAADRAPRELPAGAPFNRGRTSLPNPTAGEGGAGRPAADGPAPPRPAPPPASATRPEADRPPPSGRSPESAEGERPPARGTDRNAGIAPTPPGDRRLDLPRRELPAPPLAAPGAGGARGLPQVDNRLSRARFDGEFSLSTYEWEYAPYMRRLKRQIEEYTWTILPSAFWYGIAAWTTQVRFVILPDGTLESVALIGHEGVLELRHVAPDAVTGAADFEPLPPGFPEPELTVTGSFYFNMFPPGRESAGRGGP
jgi:hypothetical protein